MPAKPYTRTFYALHHNIIAKEIREQWPSELASKEGYLAASETLALLALSFAKRFKKDSPVLFDPLKWLDQCSPYPDVMPLSELWEDYNAKTR